MYSITGRSPFSIYLSIAPPPVETCVNLFGSIANLVRASKVSPPPRIVVCFDLAMDLRICSEPWLYRLFW